MRIVFHHNVKFCPHCGVQALDRDLTKQGHHRHAKQVNNGTEWVCRICGFAFRIMKSCRHMLADEMHRINRQVRIGKPSDNVSEEVLEEIRGNSDSREP